MQSVLIDEEKFNKVVEGLGLVVPSNEVKSIISAHKSLLMSQKNLKIVLNHSDLTKKIILFDPLCTLPESLENYEKVKIPVNLNYSNFGYFEVLQQLLPETVQVPTGFETIGHIAHFNLAEDQLPFKHLIGSVLIDVMFKKKVKNIKTVVTKIGKIEHVYRTFQMEVIAGKDDLIATVVFGSAVYWNSKLSAERDRVLEQLESNDVVCDLFAGVGPFAIRAAKKGCRVIANDLNPSCLHYLNKNIQKNKVSHLVHSYNLDARDFFKQLSSGNSEGDWLPFTHIYMNLPMDAIEFLDVFRGAFDRDLWKSLPKVHVYGFAMEQEELIERMKQVWGVFNESILTFHRFRDISPKKYMFCVEFVIPEEIAFEVLPRKIAKSEEASEN